MEGQPQDKQIIMYGTPTCPMVLPMKGLLTQAQADYEYIDISKNSSARQRVTEINHGYESVPTFVFPDDTTLTEPSTSEMKQKLQEMGYQVPITGLLMGNAWRIVTVVIIIFALLRFLEII